MAYVTRAEEGLAAVEKRDWDEALTKLNIALKESSNPAWLIARSKALIGLRRFQEALDDANLAWHKAYERNKRPLLIQAHYRRAVAYLRLGQYANADACCIYAMRICYNFPAIEKEDPARKYTDENMFYTVTLQDVKTQSMTDKMGAAGTPGNMQLSPSEIAHSKDWRSASALRIQILGTMERLPADDEARKLTISLKPEEKKLSAPKVEAGAGSAATPVKPTIPSDAPVRLQDFQSQTTMSVSIFSKGVNKEKLRVEFSPFSVSLDPIVYPNGEEKAFRLDLWGEIDATESKFTVFPSKVELNLKKKTPGKWSELKGESKSGNISASASAAPKETVAAASASEGGAKTEGFEASPSTASDENTTTAADAGSKNSVPSYPTSSRAGPKNWDSVGADEDEDDGNDVNEFFKKIFKNATPEQQRAMAKSFTESNGTSLSTNWEDVKDHKVATVPPDGVEAKEWK